MPSLPPLGAAVQGFDFSTLRGGRWFTGLGFVFQAFAFCTHGVVVLQRRRLWFMPWVFRVAAGRPWFWFGFWFGF